MLVVLVAIVLGSVATVWVRNVDHLVGVVAAEGIALTYLAWISPGTLSGRGEDAALTLGIKGVLLPLLIWQATKRLSATARHDAPAPVWVYGSVLPLLLIARHVVAILVPSGLLQAPQVLSAGVVAMGLSFVGMMARRHWLVQVVAFIAVENALTIIISSVIPGWPLGFEAGTLLDLAAVAGLLLWVGRLPEAAPQADEILEADAS